VAVQLTQRMLDRALDRAVAAATAPGGLRVTEGQLYYELCRVLVPAHRLPRRLPGTPPPPLSYRAFHAALDRHDPIPALLPPLPPRRAEIGRHTVEPDLFDYGLPRLLICASPAVTHMLRANGLPMESACPVLGPADLPLHPDVTAMLERVDGTVHLLHEASAEGMRLPARIRELAGLPETVRVVPIGLRPRQARALHLFRAPAAAGAAAEPVSSAECAGPALDPAERRWLDHGHTVELEAVRPAALLRTVHRLVRGVRTTHEPLLDLRRARTAGFLTWPAA